MKHLIINADDFGLSPGVNRGIVEAYQAGGISSTTLMVNMPGFTDAVRLAGLHPGLGVGLHFNLTYGRPVSDPRRIPSLVQADGRFHSIGGNCNRELRDIEIELSAQWDRLTASGLRPTHLDGHHHLQQDFRNAYEAMARLAAKENVPMRRPQISHWENENTAPLPLTVNQVLLDTYDADNGLQKLLSYLHNLPVGSTEIMCHPGYVDETLRGISNLTKERVSELAVFRNPVVRETIRALGIRLIHYGVLRSV
ncbi:ChbG/HpnK family deacetylase [Paenibacillus sp. Marseille-P2973]|uniref:carbohydrate deacetylase n=1 Tax=Paenibacillus sp. Marseille-P2973 TaxID=1871032 RepID=UPI001B380067|nr:ChbG/HpnK family deacetylase [Paenibacillus sp. Marseille-P2973]MBQ4901350.1 ChbG/HpnK family deacetylase [Paenibacillus sp. Marseille-P2973]